jgi:filamentous hemagglutinin family protein
MLFFSGSPAVMALQFSAGMRSSGVSQGDGGQGSAPNLQNAGAASAALTAALAQKSLQKSQSVISALTTAQKQAASVAKASLNNGQVNGKPVINGLQLSKPAAGNGQVAGLVPYYTAQNPAPGGSMVPTGTITTPGTWKGVSGLSQTISGSSSAPSSSTVTITQNQQSAYLYWSSFNVGAQTTLNFRQSGNLGTPGTWIAFNKVMGSSDPSHVFGQINSPGQVYILNQNGVLFHAGSEVNVQSLVAATLPINPNLAGDPLNGVNQGQGLANNPDYQFLFSALPLTAGTVGPTAAWTPTVTGPIGDVVVEPGAVITAPVNSANSGGLVALVGPNVENQGSISTPNGQTVLAAGLQVGMVPHPSSDPSLRGLDFYVGKVFDPSISTVSVASGSSTTAQTGTAKNDGLISIPEGDATMVGKTVLQNGGIDGSTSVSFNGRIDLLADYNTTLNGNYKRQGQPLLYQSAGLVQTGPGSAMQILPEWDSSATVTGTSLALNSLVSIQGGAVNFGSGSVLVAPGAVATAGAYSETGLALKSGVNVDAGSWYDNGSHNLQFIQSGGQIYLGPSSVIDVSGSSDVQVSSAQNFVTLQLRGAQLAGEPLQNNAKNPIYGKDLTVDIRDSGTYNGQYWIGTPLGDATGYAALVQRGVGQLTLNGGSVALRAGDSVVEAPGSQINVTGGWVQYSGGSFAVSQLINSYGQIVPTYQAMPNQIYTSIVKNPTSVYEAPYVSGGNGGAISIQAASVALDGSIQGQTVVGPRQLRPWPAGSASTLPATSSFSLGLFEQTILNNAVVAVSPYAPSITFSPTAEHADIPAFGLDGNGNPLVIPAVRQSSIALDPKLASKDGFGQIAINDHDGNVTIPAGSSLELGPGGSLTIGAANISVAGGISASGGRVSLTADRVSYELANGLTTIGIQLLPFLDVLQDSSGAQFVQYGVVEGDGRVQVIDESGAISRKVYSTLRSADAGNVNFSPQARVDLSGYLANDLPAQTSGSVVPNLTEGGNIQVAGYNVALAQGSVINVSGGGYVSSKGSTSYGNAGAISISGGQDPDQKDMSSGSLQLGATLKGFSGTSLHGEGTPGRLSVSAPAITLGGQGAAGISLPASFFSQGGFGSFSLSGIGIGMPGDASYQPGILISAGTVIQPEIQSEGIVFGNHGEALLTRLSLPSPLGQAPRISLNAVGIVDSGLGFGQQLLVRGDLVQQAGSRIVLQPGLKVLSDVASASAGSLTLSGMTVEELGTILVPGGSVVIKGGSSLASNLIENNPYVTVDLGPSALISVDGAALYAQDPSHARPLFGAVLSGGTVSINGNLIARPGSSIKADGATGLFSDLGTDGSMSRYRTDSSGGAINLTGGQVLYSDALLSALPGGSSASGGSIIASSGNFLSSSVSDPSLVITKSGFSSPVGVSGVGQILPSTDSYGVPGGAHLVVSSFQNGGFDAVTLNGNVLFAGSSPISISSSGSITAGTGGVIQSEIPVTLSAPVVQLGMPFESPLAPSSPQLTTIFGSATQPLFARPTFGNGNLQVNAGSLINMGNLSLQGVEGAGLSVANGAIRGDGNLVLAGNLTMAASQIYPSSGTSFTVVAFNHDATGTATGATPDAALGIIGGSITIQASGQTPQSPLSAGGKLSLYASQITQGGDLAAPFGQIVLGATKGNTNPKDPMSGITAPDTGSLGMTGASITSVSGDGLVVPYGFSTDGSTWIDPSTLDITTIGLPTKSINLNGGSVSVSQGALLNLKGGGDLKALDWVSGLGGTVNILGSPSGLWNANLGYSPGTLVSYQGKTWSARQANSGVAPTVGPNWTLVPQSFAILPGYQMPYAPTGYGDGSMAVGSSVELNGGGGLPAGSYTLLPASYASLPGAYLLSVANMTRNTQLPISISQPDGTSLVSGTLYNNLSSGVTPAANSTLFLLSTPAELAKQVLYQNLSASTFFASSGKPLPANGGSLTISATSIGGIPITFGTGVSLNASGAGTAAGGLVALSAPGQFTIGNVGGASGVQIAPSLLNQWQYGGLVIGGTLSSSGSDSIPTLDVTASSITLGQNVALTGTDIILAANQSINLLEGASIMSLGTSLSPYGQVGVNGEGVLVRVSGDAAATETRSSISANSLATISLGQNVILRGNSVVMDASGDASINPTAQFKAKSLSLSAGSIALVLDPQPSQGLLNDLASYDSAATILEGAVLQSAQNASSLSLTSYSTLDLYGSTFNQPSGSFGSQNMAQLSLHAGEIRGFDLGGGTAALTAKSILLDNAGSAPTMGPLSASPDGSLELDATTISLGKNILAIDQFSYVTLNATGVIAGISTGSVMTGTPMTPTDLFMTAPLITATAGNTMTVTASGNLILQAPDQGSATAAAIQAGAGAVLNFSGATIAADTTLSAPSGHIYVRATAGDIDIGGNGAALLDVSGTSKQIKSASITTDAGAIQLDSDFGNVALGSGASMNLSASGSSSAGTLSVTAPEGSFSIDPIATLNASGGLNSAKNGSFSLDVATLNPSGEGSSLLSFIAPQLSSANFTQSLSFRIRTGDVAVETYITSKHFLLTADQGLVDVAPSGVIDASGVAGGSIALQANGSVILEPNSLLTVHGDTFDAAGKGGSVFLSAGAQVNGQVNPNAVLDLQTGSEIDLGVTTTPTSMQDLGGVLHLRAPVTQNGSDMQLANVDSTILGASSIEVEGYRLYDVTPREGGSKEISGVLLQAFNDARSFFGNSGANSSTVNAILERLTMNQPSGISALVNLAPGVEIINQSGDLALNQDWDFSTFRVGANSAPGFLTLRASGDVTFDASMNDGFASSDRNANLLAQNSALPVNFQSWSYAITAGADFSSSGANKTISGGAGAVNLGVIHAGPIIASGGPSAQTYSALSGTDGSGQTYDYYQVIRTGSGDISVTAAGNILLRNQFASIYTAGTQVTDPRLGGTFDVPAPNFFSQSTKTSLGAVQQLTPYAAQYSLAGGNVTLVAGGDVSHVSLNSQGAVAEDSTSELPNNWLYRRGAVAADGTFLRVATPAMETLSTSWWVDFSNFFEGVGALGGGNVMMTAGGSINNVDAVAPTNLRMSGHDAMGSPLQASSVSDVELGGGNITLQAGGDLNAGVYYAERGAISVSVAGSVITNPTRDPQLSQLINPSMKSATAESYLPTSFFLGKGSVSVTAGGDIIMGPVANAFLLPQGINNSFWYKTYFSTYGVSDTVSVFSLGGNVTLRTEAYSPGSSSLQPLLQLWSQDMISPSTLSQNGTIAFYEPWLRLAENSVTSLSGILSIMPSSLALAAPSGDINLQGGVTLSPSATGELQLLAGGSVNGLSKAGIFSGPMLWSSSTINVSDANPDSIPGISGPLSQRAFLNSSLASANGISAPMFASINALFAETGSTFGSAASLSTKLALHDSSILHAGDNMPLEIFASSGDISGLTLYSPKSAQVIAGKDITDVGLYIQNIASTDLSLVSAGRNITLYDPSSPLQIKGQASVGGTAAVPLQSGDVQISGPGTLELFAGGNVDLGNNPGFNDTTLNLGIRSIGNQRNPSLPFQGADVVVSAGVNLPSGLSSPGVLALDSFAQSVLSTSDGSTYLSELSAQMAYAGDPLLSSLHTAVDFGSDSSLSTEQKARLEMQLFYIVLRDTGRNYSDPKSAGFRSYATARQAIQTVLNGSTGSGNITTWSQNIASANGGNIDLFTPGGGVTMGSINYKAVGSSVAPGIITEGGGAINIFTKENVGIGIGRIFTLKGGDIMIWSDMGNIAAGASSKTVQSAPPTQVLVDPQSALVEADLAGLATGGGIGTLQTVVGIAPSAVDLDAPSGVIDAGDAGIRSSGNLFLAATAILNAANIQVAGLSAGVPPPAASSASAAAPAPAPAPASAPSSASTAAAAASSSADKAADKTAANQADETPSLFSIDIMGYGGGDGGEGLDDQNKKAENSSSAPIQASL